jgi:hypothetical protein
MSFQIIQIQELPCLVKAIQEQGKTSTEEIFNDLSLLDDLLTLQKSKSLLSRKKSLKAMLDARIGQEFGYSIPNLNRL